MGLQFGVLDYELRDVEYGYRLSWCSKLMIWYDMAMAWFSVVWHGLNIAWFLRILGKCLTTFVFISGIVCVLGSGVWVWYLPPGVIIDIW